MRSVTKAFLRYLIRRRGLSVLQLMGIASGVAAACGMGLASQSAQTSFSKAIAFLEGRSTHSIKRPAGAMKESVILRLMRDPAVSRFSPVVDRRLFLPDGESVRLLGIDPFLDRAVRPDLQPKPQSESPDDFRGFPIEKFFDSPSVIVDGNLAERLGLKPGDVLESNLGTFPVVNTFPSPSGEPLVLMDIGQAQGLFGTRGFVDRVDMILSDEKGFRERWSDGFVILSGRQQKETFREMLRAFRLNLHALSLLALFVGVFLVYNTAMFAVVSRRRDAGILMGLGATRWEIVLAFLIEISLLGGIGGALGGVLGFFLSYLLTELVGGTVSSLYLFLKPAPPAWSWWILPAGILLGCGASFLGGFFPLKTLGKTDPVRAMEGRVVGRRERLVAKKGALLGALVLVFSLGLLAASSIHVYVGFAGVFGLMVGSSLVTGIGIVICGPALKKALQGIGGLPGRLAGGNIRLNLSRTAVAVAAFMVALSMSIGLGSMIGSFRETLIWWMDTQILGDLYIAPTSEAQAPKGLYEELLSVPGVGGVDAYRFVQFDYRDTAIRLRAINASVLKRFTRFAWLEGGKENWEAVERGDVVVSESFSRRFGIVPGDEITLESRNGPTPLRVAAVFYDYTTEHGLVMMNRATYLEMFGDTTIDALGVFLDPAYGDPEAVLDEVRKRAERLGAPVVGSEQFRSRILSVFDATFAVTRSMRLLGVIVAFFGIAGALLTLFMERQREFGIYRALGFSTNQLAGMTLLEGLGMGVMSFLLSILTGTALAYVLIRVINLQSFNWTIFYHFLWSPYLYAAATAVVASIGAAVYPIWRVRRTYPQMQIREE